MVWPVPDGILYPVFARQPMLRRRRAGTESHQRAVLKTQTAFAAVLMSASERDDYPWHFQTARSADSNVTGCVAAREPTPRQACGRLVRIDLADEVRRPNTLFLGRATAVALNQAPEESQETKANCLEGEPV